MRHSSLENSIYDNKNNYSLLQHQSNNMPVTPYARDDQITNTIMNSPSSSSNDENEEFNLDLLPSISSTLSRKSGSKRRSQVKNACVNCQKACKKCDEGRPCQRCIKLGITDTCVDSPRKERKKGFKRGPYRKKSITTQQHIIPKRDNMSSLIPSISTASLFTNPISIKREEDFSVYANNNTSSVMNNWSNLSSPIYNEPTSLMPTSNYNSQSNNFAGILEQHTSPQQQNDYYNNYSSTAIYDNFDDLNVIQPQQQQHVQFMPTQNNNNRNSIHSHYSTTPISPTSSTFNSNIYNNISPYTQPQQYNSSNSNVCSSSDEFGQPYNTQLIDDSYQYDDHCIQNNSTITSSPEYNMLNTSTSNWGYTDPIENQLYNNTQFISKLGDNAMMRNTKQQQNYLHDLPIHNYNQDNYNVLPNHHTQEWIANTTQDLYYYPTNTTTTSTRYNNNNQY